MALAVAAAASAAAAGYGAYSANQNAIAARRQNAANISVSQRQQALAQQQADAQMAARTDARGNRTEYIPGVGWVETLSPLSRSLLARSDQEEMGRTADYGRERLQRETAFDQQQQDRGLANALLARTNQGTRNVADIEAEQGLIGAGQAVAGRQQTNNAAMINALRGGTGAQEMMQAQGKGGAGDTRLALLQARAAAPRGFADAESARLNDGMNRYNNLMQRALAPNNTPFQQSTLADTLTAASAKQQQTGAYGMATAMQGMKAPQLGVEDDMRAARFGNFAAGIGNMLGNKQTMGKVSELGDDLAGAWDWSKRQYANYSGANAGKDMGYGMYGPPAPTQAVDPYDSASYSRSSGGTGGWS